MKRALFRRQCGVWVLARLVFLVVLSLAADGPPGVAAASDARHAQPAVVLLCIAVGLVEISRRGEHLLLGNLGVRRRHLVAVLATPPVIAEALVAVVGRI
ncbi:MAG: hypothetical protein HYV19_02415 [Gemmatimonadetes bacterium]|nr:hypothetical protein [Gemmatimonadota bacterium]